MMSEQAEAFSKKVASSGGVNIECQDDSVFQFRDNYLYPNNLKMQVGGK